MAKGLVQSCALEGRHQNHSGHGYFIPAGEDEEVVLPADVRGGLVLRTLNLQGREWGRRSFLFERDTAPLLPPASPGTLSFLFPLMLSVVILSRYAPWKC